jgi:hypothetical protein
MFFIMQCIWLENNSIIIKDNIHMPELLEGEALVRVCLAGICATDLELVNGYYPYRGCHIVHYLLTNHNKYSIMHSDEILTKQRSQ